MQPSPQPSPGGRGGVAQMVVKTPPLSFFFLFFSFLFLFPFSFSFSFSFPLSPRGEGWGEGVNKQSAWRGGQQAKGLGDGKAPTKNHPPPRKQKNNFPLSPRGEGRGEGVNKQSAAVRAVGCAKLKHSLEHPAPQRNQTPTRP